MMLRSRLTLMVSLCFVAVSAMLIVGGRIRQADVERRFELAEIAGHRNAWNGAATAEQRRIEGEIDSFADNEVVVRAVAAPADGAASRDHDLTPFLSDLLARLHARAPEVELEIARADGTVVFASRRGPARFLVGGQLANVLLAGGRSGGLVALAGGGVAVAVGEPVFTRDGAAGAAALVVDAQVLLPEMRTSTSSDVFLASPAGALIAAASDRPWQALAVDLRRLPPGGRLLHVASGARMLESTLIPLAITADGPAAIVVAMRDITASWRLGRLVSGLSYAGGMVMLALFLATLYWYLRISFRPLNAAIRVLNAMSRGDTSVAGPARVGRDEIGRLARTMESFRRAQRLLAETTAAKERIDSELAVARDIQRHIVPTNFGFPDHPEFELHAVMEPAKAVGGDLYDFFLLDERHLFFMIGDVSDKGVPAALFMAITKALFKNAAQSGDLPPLDEIMARVNRQLTADNPSEMFVTIFACLLDLETGIVTYSDGGHELPFRLRADGKGEVLPKEGGMALGFIADYPYATAEIALAPGDALMLYSDGVNEAMNPAHQMFKVGRITETLAGATAEAPAASVARSLLGAVRRFADTAPQSDDITILVVRWKGPQSLLAAYPTVTALTKVAA